MCFACLDTPAAADEFAARLLDIYNHGALGLMISVGHRTGLFDAMAEIGPATSADLARHAELDERYVREWLGAMVTGRICTLDSGTRTYELPPEHAASLTRAASPNNLAVTAQFLPQLGAVEDGIVECFFNGGGVDYGAYRNFHRIMAADSEQTVVAGLAEHVLPLVPDLRADLAEGIAVLDLGCGSGRAVNHLARRFPRSRFLGRDFSEDNLDHPLAPLLYTISTMHCMTVSLAQGGMGLGTMWGREKAREMLAEAGFRDVALHELPHDFMNDWYVAR